MTEITREALELFIEKHVFIFFTEKWLADVCLLFSSEPVSRSDVIIVPYYFKQFY